MADSIEQPFPPLEDQGGFSDGFTPSAKAAPVTSDDPEETESSPPLPFLVVGIGASAGGVEAYIELFKHLPANTGMAFVVVPHLSAEQRSYLPEILAHHTAMPTVPIETGIRPEPNHVYFLPPNARVRLQRGVFQLEMRESDGVPRPIDFFFHSLATDQKNRAIGIVLSGMDSDGALGLKAIKGEGGISMVQSPESARFPDMPRSSISADHVDLILPPDQLAHQLTLLGQKSQTSELHLLEEGTAPAGEEQSFGRILQLLRGVSGVDFRLYKPNTIRRRIARRMLMHRIDTLANYLILLQGNGKELRELHEDVLINVTRFFRDPEVFDILKNSVLPEIFQDRPLDQQVRIWVAGCSSGEEVYTIAICLLEFLTENALEPPIQIFGTDASETNIQKARVGIYPDSITAEVSAERLRRFFAKTEKGYQVAKRVRDLCIFARQNLCQDPPFSRLDLVSCRNVLIYFGSQLQRQIIPTFHYALRPNGILLLGNSETIREFNDLFALRDRKSKIYWKIGVTPPRALLDVAPRAFFPVEISVLQQASGETWGDLELQRAADRIVLARYGPPGLIVNEQLEILQSRGHTSPFLEIPQGAVTLQLARMIREDIAPYVSSAVQRAVKEDLPVQMAGLQVRDGDQTTEMTLEVLPIHSVNARSKCYLVLFVPSRKPQSSRKAPAEIELPEGDEQDRDRLFVQLQQDLSSTKLYLQSLLEERDAKNQELVSANEEIQSANEELQSTNEELETTKEELQSSNEELQTVNDELNARNTVLTQASNDLQNLLNSVNMPVLMLNNEFRIRHFTPQTQRLMNLLPTDIGRPFSDIRLNLKVDNLEPLFMEVLDTLGAREIEVQDRNGRWYLLRVRPYRTTENKIEGLVLVLVDIDQHRRSQQELRDARDFAASIIESIPLPLVVVNLDFKIRSTNEAFCALTGSSSQQLQQRQLPDLAAAIWGMDQPLRSHLENLRKVKNVREGFVFEHRTSGENSKVFCIRGRVLQPDGEHFLLVTFEDITVHKEVERLLRAERERLASEVESTARELGRSQEELRALAGSLLITSQEEERRRLARELHDDISQRLAAFDLDSSEVLRHLGPDSALAERKIQEIREQMRGLSEDVRRLSHRLHPSALEDLGLASALRSLTGEFGEREKMITTFSAQDLPPAIPIEVATGLYRIAQEALRNVAKHAGKTHVKVLLRGKPGALELQVTDSGLGFDMEDKRSGLGLISMEERARLIGATLKIESALGEGTKVTVDVPLSPSA